MAATEWTGWVPVVPVKDAEASMRFYCDILGFEKDWEHRFTDDFPLYVQVSRGEMRLHLNEHGDPAHQVTLCVGVTDVDAAHSEMTGRGLVPDGAPEDRPYGVRDFAATDPDGHHLIFAMRLPWFDEAEGREA